MTAHESVWIATTEEPGFPALDAPVDPDVAVLGAGIAGLTTALLLKNAGLFGVAMAQGRAGSGADTSRNPESVPRALSRATLFRVVAREQESPVAQQLTGFVA